MKGKIMKLLATENFWNKLLGSLGFIATGASTIIDSHIAGYVGMGVIALTGPVGKVIAKGINVLTSDYATTDSQVDDVLHAASNAIINK